MTITVKIENANLADLLAKVEAGEDVLLVRDDTAVARLQSIPRQEARQRVIEEILEFRKKMPRVTQEEIAEWKALGRR